MNFIVRSLFLMVVLASSAQASLIQNSNFDDCDDPVAFCLDDFEVFATETDDDGNESFSIADGEGNTGVFFNAGRLTPPNFFTDTTAQGGGIRQSFNFSGGDLSISVFFNTLFNGAGTATRGSVEAALFGPSAIDPDTFDFFNSTSPTDTSSEGVLILNSLSDLAEGLYTLQITFTRAFEIGSSPLFGLTGITATSTNGGLVDGVPSEVPEPGTLVILLIALAGLVATRKIKQA